MTTCISCSGTGIVFNARGSTQCSRCKGTGSAAAAVASSDLPAKRIVILGEAWGAEEARLGMPFVGASGNELNRMLEEAEIEKSNCYLTNVFNLQPKPTNDIKNLGTDRRSSTVPLPEMQRGVYLQDQYFGEVQRAWKEIAEVSPNLVIALGNTALWALTGNYGIRALRGTIAESTLGVRGLKVLPTYHPAAVLRDWSLRSVVVADLMKAKRQSLFKEIRRPARQIWVEPDIRDIERFYREHVLTSKKLSVDIETIRNEQISMIGFAPSKDIALVVPFTDIRNPTGSYWPTAYQEKLALEWCRRFLEHAEDPEIEILGQNFIFDVNWIWTKLGFTPKNFCRDTMLKHHAMNPELEKGLGFLGSVYTDEPAWKLMRKNDSTKRGE